jgi:hypothetical protein
MDGASTHHRPVSDRIGLLWQRGLRWAARVAIALGLSTATAIVLGAAVTDNAFVQILVTILAAFGFWLPFVLLVAAVDRWLNRPRRSRPESDPSSRIAASPEAEASWRRLSALAPGHSDRLVVLRRSLDESRLRLGSADLDPDANDLCILMDRRLPELIHNELDSLPPDDRNRNRQIGELLDLIEQFARHCSRKRSGDASAAGREAAILRRRFEAHLSGG